MAGRKVAKENQSEEMILSEQVAEKSEEVGEAQEKTSSSEDNDVVSNEMVEQGNNDSVTEEELEDDGTEEDGSCLDDLDSELEGKLEGVSEIDTDEEDEDVLPEEQMMQLFRRIVNATYKERKNIYGKKEKKATVKDKSIKNAADYQKEERDILNDAVSAKPVSKMLKGIVDSYYHAEDERIFVVLRLADSHGHFKINVPLTLFFEQRAEHYKQPNINPMQILESDLMARVGSTVYFVPYNVDEAKASCIGNVVEANARLAKRYFVKPWKNTGKPRVTEGSKVPARVVGKYGNKLIVNIFGAEAVIKSEDLSYLAVGKADEAFKMGEAFYVIVHDINSVRYEIGENSLGNKSYKLISLRASKVEADDNPADEFYNQFKVGQICSGKIMNRANINGTQKLFVRVCDKMDCLCNVPCYRDQYLEGDDVVVEITRTEDETKRLYGNIRR